jgi:hypothetical protein
MDVREAFGWGGTKVTEQLNLLQRAGLAADRRQYPPLTLGRTRHLSPAWWLDETGRSGFGHRVKRQAPSSECVLLPAAHSRISRFVSCE